MRWEHSKICKDEAKLQVPFGILHFVAVGFDLFGAVVEGIYETVGAGGRRSKGNGRKAKGSSFFS